MLTRRAAVGRGVRAHPPCAPDVVLEARATDRRQLVVAVAEDLDLAFAVPVARVDHTDADRAAQEATRSLEAVDDDEVALLHGRVLSPERHVQVSHAVVERPEGVVDLVVEDDRALPAVGRHDAHVLAERHRHVAVEAASLLHGMERGVVLDRASVRQAEEVDERHRDARLGRCRRRRPR